MNADINKFSKINIVQSRLNLRFPILAKSIDECFHEFGYPWLEDFESFLVKRFDDVQLIAAVDGYIKFSIQSMREQAKFNINKHYLPRTHSEVNQIVYQNDTYMLEEYLPGLLLSHFIWPHHYRQLKYFDNNFISKVNFANKSQFLEVGSGTGIYSSKILLKVPNLIGQVIDISPTSIEFTLKTLACFNLTQRCQGEIIALESLIGNKYDWIICVEVLEHLERPIEFLKNIKKILKPSGYAFITAAINAGHIDHIYLYKSASDVKVEIESAGLFVHEYFSTVAYLSRQEGMLIPEVAAFIVS